MKRSRRVVSLVLTFMLVSCLLVPMSSAAEVTRPDQGSITVIGTNSSDLNMLLWRVMDATFSEEDDSVYYTPTPRTLSVLLQMFGERQVNMRGVIHTFDEWHNKYSSVEDSRKFSEVISTLFKNVTANDWQTFTNMLYIAFKEEGEEVVAEFVSPGLGMTTINELSLGMYLLNATEESQTETSTYTIPVLCSVPAIDLFTGMWRYDPEYTIKAEISSGVTPNKVMSQAKSIQALGFTRPSSFLFDDDVIAEEGVMTAGAGQRINFTLNTRIIGSYMELHDVMENMIPDSILRYCIDYSEIAKDPNLDLNDWRTGIADIPVVSVVPQQGVAVETFDNGEYYDLSYHATWEDFLDRSRGKVFIDAETGEFFKVSHDGERLPIAFGENYFGETVYDYQLSFNGKPRLRTVTFENGEEVISRDIPICPIMNVPDEVECPCAGVYPAHISLVKEDLSNGHFRYKLDITGLAIDDPNLTWYDNIVFDYSVVLSENAVCGLQGNANTFWFDYWNNELSWSSPQTNTKVYTFGVSIDKVDEEDNPLAGAQFKLEQFAGNIWAQYFNPNELLEADWHTVTPGGYAVQDEHGREHLSADAPYTLAEDGSFIWKDNVTTFTFKGLSEGYYRLTEVKAPAGYSTVDPIYFSVGDEYSLYTSANSGKTVEDITISSYVYGENGSYSAEVNDWNTEHLHATGTNLDGMATLNVMNVPGALLPQTGGEGVATLYIAGASLILLVGYIAIYRRKQVSHSCLVK